MEENNIHTSVVIELANQGEPEEQKSYQIDIDDLNLSKDYVIDQIFCGENVTVYALFEVSENEHKNLDIIEVSSSNVDSDNRYYYKNSFKKVLNEKRPNGYKQNLYRMSSEENVKLFSKTNKKNKSFYCLEHPSKNHDLLPSEKRKSDLKVLFSKDFSSENSNSTKFKAISVGVNTDIAQSPRIIEEVQKLLGMNIPVLKHEEKVLEVPNPSLILSHNGPDAETRQSVSSVASSSGSKNCIKRSVSNYYFVPLLMMGNEILNKFPQSNYVQKNLEDEKPLNSSTTVSKISVGVNTSMKDFTSNIDPKDQDKQEMDNILHFKSSKNSNTQQPDCNERLKLNKKKTILEEIKIMQLKLNALIKTMESSDTEFEDDDELIPKSNENENTNENENENEKVENNTQSLVNSLESFTKHPKNMDDRPIFLPWGYSFDNEKFKINLPQEEDHSFEKIKENETSENLTEAAAPPVKKSSEGSLVSKTDKNNAGQELKKENIICSTIWKNFENPRHSSSSSKSEMNLLYNAKHTNGIKKSLSLDLRNIKTEVFKNIKNCSFKFEGRVKINEKKRILQSNEVYSGDNESLFRFEVGDDAVKKLNSKLNFLNPSQENEKKENSNFKDNTGFDSEKNCTEQEGDAKVLMLKPKENLLKMTFVKIPEEQQVDCFDSNVTASNDLLSPKESLSSCRKEVLPLDKIEETEKKICSESEKPPTPKENSRKIIKTNSNVKKDFKPIKKTGNRFKIPETTTKIDIPFKKITGSRKAARISGESRLHIDKLIKPNTLTNYKIPQLLKNNTDEKAGARSDRTHRPPSQKEIRENAAESHIGVNKETESKFLKKEPSLSMQVDNSSKRNAVCSSKPNLASVTSFENPEELDMQPTSQKSVLVCSNPSSAVVELLSQKPKSIRDFYSEINKECLNLGEITKEANETDKVDPVKKSRTHVEVNENLGGAEKSVVKSVWALTKVLLFEDGTKKLEVLEASLNPPEYSLNQPVKTPR